MKIEYLQGSNVISITPIRTELKFPAISQVEAYWEGLRNGRPMPARSEVDPRGISDALEYAFVLEKIAPGLARIRLAGRHLNDLLGMEVRGMPLTALFLPEARPAMHTALETVFVRPAIAHLCLSGDTGMTRPALEAQMFLAPLKDESGKSTRMLGALQSCGRIGRAPRRFSLRETNIQALLCDDPRHTPEQKNPVQGFAEPAPGFDVGPVGSEHRSHLRLVHDSVDN